MNLNVHFHCVIPDGVFVTAGVDVRFEALPAPTDAELDALLRKIARRLICQLRPPADAPEPDALDFLESAQHAALSDWQPARNNAPPKRKRHPPSSKDVLCTQESTCTPTIARGSLACSPTVPADRSRWSALGPARRPADLPAQAHAARWQDRAGAAAHGVAAQARDPGATAAAELGPLPWIICASFGAASEGRGSSACARDCSPDGPAPQPEPAAPAACAGSTEPRPPATTPPARARSRVPWAEVLSRVFKVDVLQCENCGGRMTVLAFLTERAVVKKILEHLGLPATGPPKAPARGAAQLELDERPADELRDELPNYDS